MGDFAVTRVTTVERTPDKVRTSTKFQVFCTQPGTKFGVVGPLFDCRLDADIYVLGLVEFRKMIQERKGA